MNKRFLILVGVVLCMILNLVIPIKVNALEDGLVEETQIGETTVPTSVPDEIESKSDGEEEKPAGRFHPAHRPCRLAASGRYSAPYQAYTAESLLSLQQMFSFYPYQSAGILLPRQTAH